jgi:hypothetical protein
MNAAYSQNITGPVPANMRFYVILQKPALNTTSPVSPRSADRALQPGEIPTAQELRELMDLRREINRMYQESKKAEWSDRTFRGSYLVSCLRTQDRLISFTKDTE